RVTAVASGFAKSRADVTLLAAQKLSVPVTLKGGSISEAVKASAEAPVDDTATGQGQNSNQYVVDGLDVTSGIRQGVLNLTPQPDSIQETSITVNTFTSQYSRAAGLQTMFTTRSGTDQFHGS